MEQAQPKRSSPRGLFQGQLKWFQFPERLLVAQSDCSPTDPSEAQNPLKLGVEETHESMIHLLQTLALTNLNHGQKHEDYVSMNHLLRAMGLTNLNHGQKIMRTAFCPPPPPLSLLCMKGQRRLVQ